MIRTFFMLLLPNRAFCSLLGQPEPGRKFLGDILDSCPSKRTRDVKISAGHDDYSRSWERQEDPGPGPLEHEARPGSSAQRNNRTAGMKRTREDPWPNRSGWTNRTVHRKCGRSSVVTQNSDQLPEAGRARMESRSADQSASHALEEERRPVSVASRCEEDDKRSKEQSRSDRKINPLGVGKNHAAKRVLSQGYQPAVGQHQFDAQGATVKSTEETEEKVDKAHRVVGYGFSECAGWSSAAVE